VTAKGVATVEAISADKSFLFISGQLQFVTSITMKNSRNSREMVCKNPVAVYNRNPVQVPQDANATAA